jgi:hypothetical protein
MAGSRHLATGRDDHVRRRDAGGALIFKMRMPSFHLTMLLV